MSDDKKVSVGVSMAALVQSVKQACVNEKICEKHVEPYEATKSK